MRLGDIGCSALRTSYNHSISIVDHDIAEYFNSSIDRGIELHYAFTEVVYTADINSYKNYRAR